MVALEVGRLADESQVAVKDIQDTLMLIQSGVQAVVTETGVALESVRTGVESIQDSGKKIENIDKLSLNTQDAADVIFTAIRHQLQGLDQSVNAVENINEVIKMVAVGITQTKKAIEDQTLLADELKDLVEGFKTNEN